MIKQYEKKLSGVIEEVSTLEKPTRTPSAETSDRIDKYPESASPLPSTAVTRTAMTGLSYPDKESGKLSLQRLKTRDEALGKNKVVEISETKTGEINPKTHIYETRKTLIYSVKSVGKGEQETTYYIEYGDIENLIGGNKPAVKLFYFILRNALMKYGRNPQEMAGKVISFPLKEMVDCGMYSSVRNARRGFYTAEPILTAMKVGGVERWKGKERNHITASMFITTGIVDGIAHVELHPKLDWSYICREYTIIPAWAYSLSFNAFRAITYFFIQARRNAKTLLEKGGIAVSTKALMRELNLPDPSEVKNPKRDIRIPILDAIKEINSADEKHIKESGTTTPFEIKVLSKTKPETTTSDFVEKGTFFVKIGSEYAKYFSNIRLARNNKIERAVKRKGKKNAENEE